MKIVKNVTGSGRLPSEFVQMNNWDNPYTEIAPTNKMMIEFIGCYDGHYKDNDCEWVIEEVDV